MSQANLHTLFIYGSLKRGKALHHLMPGKWLAPARTAPRYRLYRVASYYPGLVHADRHDIQRPGQSVEGELWQVDDEQLARLDAIEDLATGLYVRRPVTLEQTAAARAYLWNGPVADCPEEGPAW